MTLEGYITQNQWRANGNFTFSANQTGNPWENGQSCLNFPGSTGSAYASFLVGQPNNLALSQNTDTKMGNKAFGFFAQDNWKVTPKLTLEYGLRYDYQTYLSEQYGRLATASFSTFNPDGEPPWWLSLCGWRSLRLRSVFQLSVRIRSPCEPVVPDHAQDRVPRGFWR